MTEELIKSTADQFRDYWIAKAGAGATKLDWEATWRNWVRRIEKPKNGKKHEPPWWNSEKLIDAKAREVGAWPARGGESWDQYKSRISARIREVENEHHE
jgi:nicotinamide mononucleotide adenylyltransferase